jgi:8-oxo-dGTP pyrophosphatase MutT (NUDIX family)
MMNEDTFHLGVKAIITNPENQVLLLRSNIETTNGEYWDLPGGRLQRGHSLIETLEREILEETGLHVGNRLVNFVGAHLSTIRIKVDTSDVGLIFFVFHCHWEDQPEIRLSTEHVGYKWTAPREAAVEMRTRFPEEFILNNIKTARTNRDDMPS